MKVNQATKTSKTATINASTEETKIEIVSFADDQVK